MPFRGPLDPAHLEGDWVRGGCWTALGARPDRDRHYVLWGRGVGEAVGMPPIATAFALEEEKPLIPSTLSTAVAGVADVVLIEF